VKQSFAGLFEDIYMQLYRIVMPIVLLAPLSLAVVSAHAQVAGKSTTTTTTVITTAVPAPKEIITEPEGYVSCTTVAAGWDNNIWHDAYQVCRYDTKSATIQGEAWVAGHWQCSEYTMAADQSECTSWEWKVATLAEIQ
jgi:hypothetical protein